MRAYTQGKSHARPSALAASKVKEREFLRPANELLLRSGSALPPKKLVFRVACAIFCLYSGAYYLVYSCCTSDYNWRLLLTTLAELISEEALPAKSISGQIGMGQAAVFAWLKRAVTEGRIQ